MPDDYTETEKLTALEKMRNSINPAVRALAKRNLEAVRAFSDIALVAKLIIKQKEEGG